MAIDQFCLIIGKYFEKAFLRGGGLNFNRWLAEILTLKVR